MTPRRVTLLSVILAVSWQWALVHLAYNDNWTSLFCAGDQFTRPAEIQSHEYLFNGPGYDGQFYQLIAHDPVFTRHYDTFIDAPRLRYRRILVPGSAYLLAAGNQSLIDWTYFTNYLLLVALGTWCLAKLACTEARSALWGFLFLITPATLVGLERMTVDTALAALALAALLAARAQRWLLLWLSLAGAMLAKETGILLIAAVVLWLARQGKYRLAAALSSSLLPVAAWYLFVQSHATRDLSLSDFSLFTAYLASLQPPLNPGVLPIVFRFATLAAVAAILWATVRSVIIAFRNRFTDLAPLFCMAFALVVLAYQNRDSWAEPNGFARIYSPLLVCLIAATWRQGFTQTLVIFGAAACPAVMQLGIHLAGPVLRKLLHF
jgi:hypothetical protein